MGRSESRLSTTRSAVVRSSLRLPLGTPGLSLATPVPPYTLLWRQSRVARLRNRRLKDIEAANVLPFSGDLAQALVHAARTRFGQLSDAANSQQLEIAKHGRPDRN